ncbi:Rox3 mediator complex subunit-domain-containing protein [Clohesyomyces aquaticus]|uniref:Mediator of RNA polymerase II transcription subunit 19 n=1 Tax=Clohesyomyces aquaticus TaxID=1231657 RepID=A0A1Y1ZTD5_9PLEO|nr:Rox3 mediator complex subunit-domain-containing protein [Clohesyomyces aquaticus]
MSSHPPKRQRLNGSFSPASPPYHQAVKPNDHHTKPIVHPNTPTSPPYMSTNPQPNGGFPATATAPSTEMTPPSSVSMSQQVSQLGASASNPLPFPTPSSTTGVAFANIDSDGDVAMAEDGNDDTAQSAKNRRSNHNRQRKGKGAVLFGERGPIDGLLFKLHENEHPNSRPHGSQNLFDLYGLNNVAATVARTDPVTGEKINKLRKSYEGHIKQLHISGRPKANKIEGALTDPLRMPDEEWQSQKITGKDMKNAFNDSGSALSKNFDSLLSGALTGTAPGALPNPETQRYRTYIGTDEVKPKPGGTEGMSAGRVLQPNPGTPFSSAPSPAPRSMRPERSGAKRSYQDTSFVGYSEGFADDADSTAGEEAGPKKKQKFGFGAAHPMGMVGGVRR